MPIMYSGLSSAVQVKEEKKSESRYRDRTDSRRNQSTSPRGAKVLPTDLPHILLVDDDPTFGKIMNKAATQNGGKLTYCKNLEEFASLGDWNYDVVLMDYDLGAVTGFELTSYFENFTKQEVPVVLISSTTQASSKSWPSAIREFVHKALGPHSVLDAAYEAHRVYNKGSASRVKKPA